MNSKFIAVDGLDGSGKTTCIKFLKEYLESKGKHVHVTKAIGSGFGGWGFRQILLSGEIRDQNVTNLLTVACHVTAINEINSLRKNSDDTGKEVVVIHDRYLASYWAYNYLNPMLDNNEDIKNQSLMLYNSFLNINEVNKLPDLYLYIDIDPNVAKERIDQREEAKVYSDLKSIEYFEKLKKSFDDFFETNLFKRTIVDNNTEKENMFNQIKLIADKLLTND